MSNSMKYAREDTGWKPVLLLAAGMLAMACTSASALEFKDLTMDVNDTPLPWLVWDGGQAEATAGVGPVRPTHIADMYVVDSRFSLGRNSIFAREVNARILSSPTGRSLSQAQKDLISTGQGIAMVSPVLDGRKLVYSGWDAYASCIPNCIYVRMYGVSGEECRKTVKAFVEALDRQTGSEEANAEQRLVESQVNKDRIRQKLGQNTLEIDVIVTKSGVVLSPEDVGRIASTAEEMRNSLQIDVAGLNARIAEITKTLGKGGGTVGGIDDAMRARLQQMLIDQNIELAGVLAKLKVLDDARTGAKEKYMDSLRLIDLRKESEEARGKLAKAEDAIQQAERALQKVKAEKVEAQVFQNKVTIYPVKAGK